MQRHRPFRPALNSAVRWISVSTSALALLYWYTILVLLLYINIMVGGHTLIPGFQDVTLTSSIE